MCGRYNLVADAQALVDFFDLSISQELDPLYNIAPSMNIPVVLQAQQGRVLSIMQWGLIPYWSKERKTAYRTINARAETVAEKPAFRAAFRSRRCLIPATGFYEWKQTPAGKQPYNFRVGEGRIFAFAGLWESWQQEGEQPIESTTIIVTEANKLVRPVHDRMPVILHPDNYPIWLNPEFSDIRILQAMLAPCPENWLNSYPVSSAIGNPEYNDSRCIEPLSSS